MRKLTTIVLLASVFFYSCQKEMVDLKSEEIGFNSKVKRATVMLDTSKLGPIVPLEESPLKQFLREQSNQLQSILMSATTSTPSTLFDLRDLPINIIVKGNSSGDRFLTSNGVGKEVTLAVENLDNPHQRFSLSVLPLTGYMIIKNVEGNIVSAGQYTNNPNVDILYVKDSNDPIGASWNFKELTENTTGYVLENADALGFDGPEPTLGNVYNKVIGAQGTKISLDKYTSQLRQQFDIRVIDDFELQSIEYINDARATIAQVPDFKVSWIYNNGTSVQQSITTDFGSKASRTSTFNNTTSFSLKVNTSIKAGVPFFATGKIETEIASSTQFSYGTSETIEDTRNYNFPLIVPANTRVEASATVTQYRLNVPYIATLIGKNTGNIIKVAGMWEGVDLTDVVVASTQTNLITGIQKSVPAVKKTFN